MRGKTGDPAPSQQDQERLCRKPFQKQHLLDQAPPRQLAGRQRPAILPSRLGNMACPTKRLEPVHAANILAGLTLQRRDVVALKSAGLAAFNAAESIALEDGAADGALVACVDGGVVVAHFRDWSAGRDFNMWFPNAPLLGQRVGALFDLTAVFLRSSRPNHYREHHGLLCLVQKQSLVHG